MSEAVIVDAVRTPIGKAIRGTLRDLRADDLAAIPLRALVERNPEVDFRETIDVMMGCSSCSKRMRNGSPVSSSRVAPAANDHTPGSVCVMSQRCARPTIRP